MFGKKDICINSCQPVGGGHLVFLNFD